MLQMIWCFRAVEFVEFVVDCRCPVDSPCRSYVLCTYVHSTMYKYIVLCTARCCPPVREKRIVAFGSNELTVGHKMTRRTRNAGRQAGLLHVQDA